MSESTATQSGNPSNAQSIRLYIPRRRADMATLMGFILAFGLIGMALFMGGSAGAFLNGPAFLIVFCGTIAVTMISFTLSEVLSTLHIIGSTMFRQDSVPKQVAKQLLDIAVLARQEGILSLQKAERELKKDEFLYKGVQMVTDGSTSDEIYHIMSQEIDSLLARYNKGISVLRRAAESAPAMGLIGTLVGLVQMLAMLDDPSSIGPAMAVALLTTFYGALLGTVVCSPLAAKLEINTQAEALEKNLVLSALTSIARQENPRRLEMILNSELPPAERIRYFD